MELIQLTPHSEVDPSQPLRAPGEVESHQRVPSSVVFRMRMSRKSADGQPWLTAAT